MPSTPNIRVRLAPSPTGEVHIGTIWIAQFNWLFAKQRGGSFIVRLEDTDQKRLVPGSIEKIYEALDWYGLTPDEGPNHGGAFGPYVQSERLSLYRSHAEQLIQSGKAYWCFCTPERLDELRQSQEAAKQPPRYDKRCAALSPEEVSTRRQAGESAVVRLNMPAHGSVTLPDVIRGDVTFSYDQIDDSVLLKTDGFPTYHLAVVVDDHLMEISHVIRGEEWLPSTPKHLYLYESFGWAPPTFAHLPLILGTDKKKLSKRHNAASALTFRDSGYLPETMQNFLALMGWHPKGDEEVLPREEIIKQFDLASINPSGAIFDQTKLDWLNGWYLRHVAEDDLLSRLQPFWPMAKELTVDEQRGAVRLVRERLKTLADITTLTTTLLPLGWTAGLADFDRSLLIPKKSSADEAKENILWAISWLQEFSGDWKSEVLKEKMIAAISTAGKTNGGVLWPTRVALTLQAASPDVFDVLAYLGKEESLRRLQTINNPQ